MQTRQHPRHVLNLPPSLHPSHRTRILILVEKLIISAARGWRFIACRTTSGVTSHAGTLRLLTMRRTTQSPRWFGGQADQVHQVRVDAEGAGRVDARSVRSSAAGRRACCSRAHCRRTGSREAAGSSRGETCRAGSVRAGARHLRCTARARSGCCSACASAGHIRRAARSDADFTGSDSRLCAATRGHTACRFARADAGHRRRAACARRVRRSACTAAGHARHSTRADASAGFASHRAGSTVSRSTGHGRRATARAGG